MKRRSYISLSLIRYSLLLLIVSFFTSTHLFALNVGDIKLESKLGNPLLATIPLIDIADLAREEIHIKQASLQIYEDLGVDRNALYRTLLFDVDENNIVNISSIGPIKEPYLHFVIQIRWPEGQLYREVKLLIDPPGKTN